LRRRALASNEESIHGITSILGLRARPGSKLLKENVKVSIVLVEIWAETLVQSRKAEGAFMHSLQKLIPPSIQPWLKVVGVWSHGTSDGVKQIEAACVLLGITTEKQLRCARALTL
jgi:hypothetical protein